MAAGLHHVRRQSWQLRVGSAKEAFAARARFRAEVEDLAPAFNRVFDAWAPGEEVLHIPRLELRLRVASLDDLEQALGDALRREAPPRPVVPAPAPGAEKRARLLAYLETGTLPWHAAQSDAASASAELREIALAERQAAVAAAPAAGAISATLRYYVRLLQLLPPDIWSGAAAELPGQLAASPQTHERPVVPAASPARARRESEPSAARALDSIIQARARLGERTASALAAAVLAALRRNGSLTRVSLEEALFAFGIGVLPDLPPEAAAFIAALGPQAKSGAAGVPGADAIEREHSAAETRGRTGATRKFALLSPHAGLVLLHPFLPRLFEACELHRPGRALDARSLPRAAALLHWLATGRGEVYEFELAAIKILLGRAPEAPLPVSPDLIDGRDREEGAELLFATIRHWKALKSTSIDGLRLSFLQRRGALTEEDPGWRLQLESESFDVLLKHLPWSIETVRLPWMTRPLYSHWPTI